MSNVPDPTNHTPPPKKVSVEQPRPKIVKAIKNPKSRTWLSGLSSFGDAIASLFKKKNKKNPSLPAPASAPAPAPTVLQLQQQLSAMKKRLQNLQQSTECVICMENTKEYACEPCGHLMYCKVCNEARPELCPVCQTLTTNTKHIYA